MGGRKTESTRDRRDGQPTNQKIDQQPTDQQRTNQQTNRRAYREVTFPIISIVQTGQECAGLLSIAGWVDRKTGEMDQSDVEYVIGEEVRIILTIFHNHLYMRKFI